MYPYYEHVMFLGVKKLIDQIIFTVYSEKIVMNVANEE